jgi:hypothetical protein
LNHSGALAKLTFKELCSQARDAPTLLKELFVTHSGDTSKLGVQKLTALIKALKGKVDGRATNDRKDELAQQCSLLIRGREEELRELAATAPAPRPPASKARSQQSRRGGKRKKRADSSDEDDDSSDDDDDDEEEDDDDDEDPPTPPSVDVLTGRTYTDLGEEEEEEWGVRRVGYDRETEAFVAFIYKLADGVPSTAAGLDWIPAEELMDANWAKWHDGKPGRTESAEGVGASVVVAAADGASDDDRDDEDEASSFSRLELELELARWGSTGDDSGDAADPPIVEFDDAAAADALPLTKLSVPPIMLPALKFYSAGTLVLDGGTGERCSLARDRRLDDDQCLVFEDDDCNTFLFRIEDVSRDEKGEAWVHGAYLYSAAQLPTETQAELPANFDRSCELIESVNRVMEPLLEVKSVTRVTPLSSARGANSKFRAGRVYVDDMPLPKGSAWLLKKSKSRDSFLTNNNNSEREQRQQRRCLKE